MIHRAPAVVAAALALVPVAGCLGPQVDDTPAPTGQILPAGAAVPSADDDPGLNARIAAADGVDGTIPRLSAFADGAPIHAWDFGPAPDFAAPLFVLVDGDGPIAHPTIIAAAPGDPGYSPYWAVFFVPVTDAYAGEQLTSMEAVQEAEALGLVGAPEPQDFAVNCPAVATGVDLDVGAAAPLPPPSRFFYQGVTVRYYDFGVMPLIDRVRVPAADRYLLRREGGEPLNERVRNIDLTGDGDTVDSNDILAARPDRAGFSPLCRTVTVAVPSTTSSIDTTGDDTMADLRDATQLFDPTPVPGVVVAYDVTDELYNCPQQREPGNL